MKLEFSQMHQSKFPVNYGATSFCSGPSQSKHHNLQVSKSFLFLLVPFTSILKEDVAVRFYS